MTATSTLRPDTEMILRAWEALNAVGEVREIRVPKIKRSPGRRPRFYKPQAGWFDDAEAVVSAVRTVRGDDAEAVYVTINPVDPELRARRNNRLDDAGSTTSDDDVLHLRYLLIDCDADQKTDIPATDEEKAEAIAERDALRDYLTEIGGWPEPFMVGDTGNGGALLCRIDLANTPQNADLLSRVLKGIASEFSHIDESTFNPSRLMKLPGTISAKGDGLPHRPWRVSSAKFNEDAGLVTREMLEQVARLAPQPEPARSNGHYDGPSREWTVEDFLSLNNLNATPRPTSYGTSWDLDRCLTSNDHVDGVCLIEMSSGALVYKCQHNRCQGKDWKYLRDNRLVQIPGQADFNVNGAHQPKAKPVDDVTDSNHQNEDLLPPFPVDALPEPFRSLTREGAAASDIDPALVALPLLAIAGGLIGPAVRLELKRGWTETAQLWLAVIAEPGRGKTPGERHARQGLEALQKEAHDRYEHEEADYQAQLADWSGRPEGQRGPRPQPPRMTSYYTADATMEALTMMLAVRSGLTNLRDELVSWVRSCDAYRGGRGGDRSAWLSLWSGVPVKVDRKSGKPVYIDNPVVSVAGGIQPDMLPALAEEANRRDGFIERMLFSFPVDHVPGWTEDEISRATADAVGKRVALLATITPQDRPIHLSAPAREAWRDWYLGNTEDQQDVSGILGGIYAKLPIQLARLILLLHVTEEVSSPSSLSPLVKSHTVARAIQLVEYFRAHAHRVVPYFGEAVSVIPGLSPEQQIALNFIRDQGEARSSEVADLLGTSQPSAANIIGKLRKKGHVVVVTYGVYAPAGQHDRNFTSDETDETDEGWATADEVTATTTRKGIRRATGFYKADQPCSCGSHRYQTNIDGPDTCVECGKAVA